MSENLRISVRFLDGTFHGRGDDGDPEWPPSPLRLFQALTNAAARLDGAGIGAQGAAALRWLEALKLPPEILADKGTLTTGYKLYVPDNVADLVAKQWSAGKYFDNKNHPIDIAGYRTEKDIRPMRLSGDASVHYLWPLDATAAEPAFSKQREAIIAIARSVTHLGWGVDLVVAEAAVDPSGESDRLRAQSATERWLPVETSGGTLLRVPNPGTLDALEDRHTAFLGRLQTTPDGRQFFRPVPPLATFRVVTYRRETELAQPPYAVFALRRPDDSGFAAFDPQWRRLHLAGMLRHAASQTDLAAALGWDAKTVNAFVLGHDTNNPDTTKPNENTSRLIFIPLPSYEWRGETRGESIGAIRRVLVTVSGHFDAAEFQRIVRALEGRELIDEKTKNPAAFLRRQSDNDRAIAGYIAESAVWTTVTPVVLPGYDDPRKLRRRLASENNVSLTAAEKEDIVRKLDRRIDSLIRKAIRQAGFPEEFAACAEIEWRGSGFVAGTDLASRYAAGDQHRRFRKLHIRVRWRDRSGNPVMVPGPICIGCGKFTGCGLFVRTN